MIDKNLFRSIVLVLAIAAIVLNLMYFVKSHRVWRWIKLVYAINNGIMAIYMALALAGHPLGIVAQYLMLILLLFNIIAGAVVSLARLEHDER